MELVSETSEEDVAHHRKIDRVLFNLRALTANLLRVVAGGGRAEEIWRHANDFIVALQAYHDGVGAFPPDDDFREALKLKRVRELSERPQNEDELAQLYAERDVVVGALRMAASELLAQRTQEAAGHSLMYEGMRQIEKVHETVRQRHRAEEASARASPRTKKGRRPTNRADRKNDEPIVL